MVVHPDGTIGAFDTIAVMPVADATQLLEIARGNPGDGLDWVPDSHWLAAGLRGRVVLLSADGRDLVEVSPPSVETAHPLWGGPHDLWYAQSTGEGDHIMQVAVR